MFYILSYFVRNFRYQTLFFCHFILYVLPRKLGEIAADALEWRENNNYTLSSLSTADEIVRIFWGGTPHTSKMPSRILR